MSWRRRLTLCQKGVDAPYSLAHELHVPITLIFKIIPYIYILEDKKFPLNELNNNKKKIMLKIQKKSQDTNLKSFLLKIS
jgi:hypothetical protein